MDSLEAEYYAEKISIVILVVISGVFLALMLHLSNAAETNISENGIVKRQNPGQGDQQYELVARNEDGTVLGEYEIDIGEQLYTPEEAEVLFDQAASEVESIMLGENQSLDRVSSDLNLVKKLDNYPFAISWQSDNYEVIGSDGKIASDELPEDGMVVSLTATYKYDGKSWQQLIYVRVIPKELTQREKIEAAIRKLLQSAEEESKYEEDVILPGEYEQGRIIWSEKRSDNSLIFLVLMLIAGGALYVMKDKELQNKMEKRREQLLEDYPQLISQLVMFLGAGMTVRNIIARMSDEYLQKKEQGMPPRFMYEELVRTNRELLAGKSEAKAYEAFGLRCQGQEYTRLSTLLSQNLRKGNSELLRLLQEEAVKAFDDRMTNVRKKGEEAGTKLLLPMILMLLIVMVVILIPAYMTF